MSDEYLRLCKENQRLLRAHLDGPGDFFLRSFKRGQKLTSRVSIHHVCHYDFLTTQQNILKDLKSRMALVVHMHSN